MNLRIDKQRIARFFERSQHTYDQAAEVQKHIQQCLYQYYLTYASSARSLLEIGCGTGGLSHLLTQDRQFERAVFNDFYCSDKLKQILAQSPAYMFIQADAEHYDFGKGFDVLLSASSIQWFESPLSIVDQARRCLNTSGVLLLSTFAPDNLSEVQALTGSGLHYPSLLDWQEALSEDFNIHILEVTQELCFFQSPIAVLQHLKQTGVNALSQKLLSPSALRRFLNDYAQRFACDNQVSLTYRPLYCVASKKG